VLLALARTSARWMLQGPYQSKLNDAELSVNENALKLKYKLE
jgi:hypothetical protein